MLTQLASLSPDRIDSRKREKWEDFEVSDSTGTDVIAFSDGKEQGHFKVGKESGGVTYIRRDSEQEVYAVSGSFSSVFNQKFNEWRDGTLLRLNTKGITKITFSYPADSGFVLSKKDNAWMIGDIKADSAKTAAYLNKLSFQRLDAFADDFQASTKPDVIVNIEGEDPVIVRGWKASFPQWILNSDVQKDVYFTDEGDFVSRAIFPGKNALINKSRN